MISLLVYCVTGVFAGLAAGMFGVGGGTVIVPVLILTFAAQGMPSEIIAHVAVGTSLAAIVVAIGSAAYAHYKRGALSWSLFFMLAPGMFVGVALGSLLAGYVSGATLRIAVAALLLLVGLKMLFNWNPSQRSDLHSKGTVFGVANIIGVICAFTGVGGGGLTVPYLSWCGVRIHNAIATSAACGVVIASVGMLGYIWTGWSIHEGQGGLTYLGFVHLPAAICVALFSAVAAPVGAYIAHRTSEDPLRIAFACFLMFGAAIVIL